MKEYFCHLHCHTSYSLLDGAANIPALMQQNKLLGMEALAITDHGNMFGVVHFINEAKKAGIKPIIGCEAYVAPDMHSRDDKRRYHQLLLVKNEVGYHNLMKLCSLSYTEGFYYKPRIDKETIKKHAEGLIATTCCLGAEVPRAILEQGEEVAEKIFLSWLAIFGEDYYIELQRHGLEEQEICNKILRKWSKKYNVKIIATNDVHYIKQEDSLAQDILLCLQTGKLFNDPNRMRFTGDQFYLKSPQEMLSLFPEVPEAIYNTEEIVNKITTPILEKDLIMPIFDIPKNFDNQGAYLWHLTFECAKKRYGNITPTIKQRLDYELNIIVNMGFAGYFLIVQDMVNVAKQLSVCVGPGRGSIAGSAVAYALGITDVEPIQYKLLFERFLNPDRITMPDIDIDFDDQGREQVIQYLVKKYGEQQVAHIITFSTLGPKSTIRGVARVLDIPLKQADALAKLVPNKPGITFEDAYKEVPELVAYRKKEDVPEGKILAISETLEGSQSHTGIHAAGIIIADRPIIELIPIKTDKNTNLLVTQYDGSIIESVGMLKMDLLGLKTLSIIRDTLRLIEQTHGEQIDINKIPLDDPKTFALYQAGATVATFQFESDAMRIYLQQLKPTCFEHLVAMNALHRPGPKKNIPNYIRRMHGKETIDYMHPSLQEILAPTFGIPVYQEQIMQMAQAMAGYTLAQADILRRAMGKKKKEEMQEQETNFIHGAKTKNIDEQTAKKVFETMSYFAAYGFNRSHSVAYTLVAYQTGYLKANYPTAYMAACLIHNQKNMDKIMFFIEECQRMNIEIKGPDINKSDTQFRNDTNTIRFGLAAIKGLGEKAIEQFMQEREQNGPYKDFSNLVKRLIKVNQGKSPGKKPFETLAISGAFDSFQDLHRRQYIHQEKEEPNFIEQTISYEQKNYNKKIASKQFLFALQTTDEKNKAPTPPHCTPYTTMEKLKIEREYVGFYISGHPLADFKTELQHLCNAHSQNVMQQPQNNIRLAGIVQSIAQRQSSKGNTYAILTLEDYHGTLEIMLFGETYNKCRYWLAVDKFVYIKGNLKPSKGQEDRIFFQVQNIEDLSTALEVNTRNVQLYLPIQHIDKTLVDNLVLLFKKYQGTCSLQIILPHEETQSTVLTSVKKYKITPSKKFFQALEASQLKYLIHYT